MATSAVPAAIEALLSIADAALTDADVHDGPPTRFVDSDWVAIGYSPAGDTFSAVDGWTQAPAALGAMSREERFEVIGTLASTSGDPEMEPRRVRAFQMLAVLEQAVRDNSDLNGTVRFAEVTAGSFLQERGTTEAGRSYTSAGIDFRISVQVRI